LGFAKQLSQLVKEQPASYAERISVLEDAKPQYADVVLDGLSEALQNDGRFLAASIVVLRNGNR